MNEVGIAQLKNQLSEQLRKVRRGESLIVLDRQTPIARIIPFEEDDNDFQITPPRKRAAHPASFPRVAKSFDVLEGLLEERSRG